QPGQWYKLLLVATDQGVKGFLDSEEVCVANAASFGQGKIGVLYEGNGVPPDLQFDDIQVASVRDVTIAETSSVPWTQVTTQVPDTGDRLPLWVTGWPGWRDYRVTAEFTSTGNSPVGLCFGYAAPDEYYLLCGRTGEEAHEWLWELWKVSAGEVRSVDRARAAMVDRPDAAHDRWHVLSAEIIEGCVSVSVDGSVILTAVDEEMVEGKRQPGGQVGLLSVDSSVRQYRNLTIAFPSDTTLATKVTAQFTKENTMAQWASPVGDWQNGKDGWIWHRGHFFGDCGFTFPLPNHKGPGYLETILSGDGHDLGRGYRFRAKVQEGKPLSCQLQRNGEVVASRKGVKWEPGSTLTFRRDRNFIRASLDEQTVLAYCDRDPLIGASTGFGVEGIPLDLKGLNQPRYGTTPARRRQQRGDLLNTLGNILLGEILKSNAPEVYRVLQHANIRIDFVRIFSKEQQEKRRKQKAADPKLELAELSARSPYLYECNFSTAPVDWRAADGDWQVRQRWTCSPQWTFFGGSGGKRPTLWSKPQFFGDHVVEFFAAKPMDPSTGGDSPSDLNLTTCGDGEHLDSGYSFVVAGNGGQTNQVLRKGKVLAEGPYKLTTNDPHRSWFHIRAEKIGDTLRLSVDDEPALTVVDSEPLPGGSIAFWSNPHGMMIAKVRVWHSGERSEE
ncbi:MAG: hypothetical protein HY318_01130, partial [Armatimonadetes bacterium]|nr:hypothetical protein [Armatimonadota bacterium]